MPRLAACDKAGIHVSEAADSRGSGGSGGICVSSSSNNVSGAASEQAGIGKYLLQFHSYSTSRERPKSALYVRLKMREVHKIVKGGPFGLFETPVLWKIRKKLNFFGEKVSKNLKMRFLNSVTVPKNVQGGLFGIFCIHSVAKYRNK